MAIPPQPKGRGFLANNIMKNKEKRNVKLTLEKAKEWYKKGGELKEVALQAFSEKELKEDNRSHSWAEYTYKNHDIGFCTNLFGNIDEINCNSKSAFPTKEYAEAALALSQLLQLRQEWIGDLEPVNRRYNISVISHEIGIDPLFTIQRPLSFPTGEMANEFLNDFRDLLEIAKPLI